MLDGIPAEGYALSVRPISAIEASAELAEGFTSCVGHADTAVLLTALLGHEVVMARNSTSLRSGDVLIVGQYNGPRLPEGAKSLPEGAKIRFFRVEIP
jgi:hypothetical protein